MRILTLCYEFPPIGGGAARVVHGLSRELVRRGHEVAVVTMGLDGLPSRESVDGIDVHRVPGIRRLPYQCSIPEAACHIPLAMHTARRLARAQRFDIVHAHFVFPDGFIAWRLCRGTGLPFLITAHGSDVPGYDPHRLRIAHRVLAPIWRSVVATANVVVCPSGLLAQQVRDSASAVRIQVIPNGLEVGEVGPFQSHRRQILVVSKMLERKGVQYLVRAVKGLDSSFDVHIVGDGPYMPEIRRVVAETGAAVQLWGWLDNSSPQLAQLFETSSIFVLPSESENFPIVLLEAMRAGLAIVTTQGTGCAEVVGDAALLIEARSPEAIRSALTRLVTDPGLCQSLGNAARARIESNFSWRAVAGNYLDLYQQNMRLQLCRDLSPGYQR